MHVPSADELAALAAAAFDVHATAVPLAGERDLNARLDVEGNPTYVLKVHAAGSDRLSLQDAALRWLAEHPATVGTPRLAGSADVVVAGETRGARLLEWIDGDVWAHTEPTDRMRHALGGAVADLDAALAGFDHPTLDAPYRWSMMHADALRQLVPLVPEELRAFVEAVTGRLDGLLATLRSLPAQAIHNDANEHNVLVSPAGTIAGILDVGDVVRAPRVCGLAVAVAYAQLGAADPVTASLPVVRGYHERAPLSADELDLLPDLVELRLAMSIGNAADQRRADPDNAYLDVSQPLVRQTVEALADTPRELRAARYRDTCGLPPVENAAHVVRWLGGDTCAPASILRHDLRTAPAVVLDWQPTGPEALHITRGTEAVTAEIGRLVTDADAALATGRYAEHRDVYRSAAFAPRDGAGERRTVHLGIDLFVPAGEPVFAPLDATVRAVDNRTDPYDYGGVVLLEHHTDDGVPFWLLAGHLAADVTTALRPGRRLRRGEWFGTVGDVTENGQWPPHVHVQLFTTLLGRSTDLPGVVRRSELSSWQSICPDPNLLLGIRNVRPAPTIGR